jgi:hypothetical protein
VAEVLRIDEAPRLLGIRVTELGMVAVALAAVAYLCLFRSRRRAPAAGRGPGPGGTAFTTAGSPAPGAAADPGDIP